MKGLSQGNLDCDFFGADAVGLVHHGVDEIAAVSRIDFDKVNLSRRRNSELNIDCAGLDSDRSDDFLNFALDGIMDVFRDNSFAKDGCTRNDAVRRRV